MRATGYFFELAILLAAVVLVLPAGCRGAAKENGVAPQAAVHHKECLAPQSRGTVSEEDAARDYAERLRLAILKRDKAELGDVFPLAATYWTSGHAGEGQRRRPVRKESVARELFISRVQRAFTTTDLECRVLKMDASWGERLGRRVLEEEKGWTAGIEWRYGHYDCAISLKLKQTETGHWTPASVLFFRQSLVTK